MTSRADKLAARQPGFARFFEAVKALQTGQTAVWTIDPPKRIGCEMRALLVECHADARITKTAEGLVRVSRGVIESAPKHMQSPPKVLTPEQPPAEISERTIDRALRRIAGPVPERPLVRPTPSPRPAPAEAAMETTELSQEEKDVLADLRHRASIRLARCFVRGAKKRKRRDGVPNPGMKQTTALLQHAPDSMRELPEWFREITPEQVVIAGATAILDCATREFALSDLLMALREWQFQLGSVVRDQVNQIGAG